MLLQWEGDEGAQPSWEPLQVVQKRFPGLLLEAKDAAKEGEVVTVQPSARLKETETEHLVDEAEFDTNGGGGKEPERSIAKHRSRRQIRPPDHFGDFTSR